MNRINSVNKKSVVYKNDRELKNSLLSSNKYNDPTEYDLNKGDFDFWVNSANNPKTPTKSLNYLYRLIKLSKELGRNKKLELYKALASNPNTPEPHY